MKNNTSIFPTHRNRKGFLAVGFLTLILSLFGVIAFATDSRASTGKKEAKAKAARQGEAGNYIVVYRDSVALSSRLKSENSRGIEVDETYRNVFKGFAAELDSEDVRRLERDDSVLIVEPDEEVTTQTNGPQDRSTPSWGLDRVDQRNLPLNSRLVTADNGFGVEAYIIDTGVRLDHSQFSGRINPEGFSAFPGGWNDCDGHGTHVAGTVAGSTYGVAPAARITAVRVLDCSGSGSVSTVIAGLDWMIGDHRSGEAAVANMSLGGSRSESENLAVKRAVDDGITMVVAAGNSSGDACNESPASAPEAVTVGSTTNTDRMSSFSNVGPCVDLFAPGSDIRSASANSPSAVETLSGTSMAAPHVAGAAALLLSRSPAMSPTAVSERLVASSSPDKITQLGGCSANRLLFAGSGSDLPPPSTPNAPANDNFADRQTLSSLNAVNGSSVCATAESGEPGHAQSQARASIWYRWTAPSNGTLTVDTSGSSFDTTLAVYTGSSVGFLVRQAQDDDSGEGLASRASLSVTGGATYSIAIDGFLGASGTTRLLGTFTSGGGDTPEEPTPPPPGNGRPANDDFSDRQSLTTSSQTNGTNTGATAESGEPGHAQSQARASIWYRWTAPSNGTLTVDTSGSSFDTTLAVYTGSSVGSLVRQAQDDDSGEGLASRASLSVTGGTTYSIAIDGYFGDSGTTRLFGTFASGGGGTPEEPTPPPPGDARPANDDFARAAAINSINSTITGTNVGATTEALEPSHDRYDLGGPYRSIWYRWTPQSNGSLTLDVAGSQFDYPRIAVYTGDSVSSLTRVGADMDDLTIQVQAGIRYSIAIDTWWPDEFGTTRLSGSFRAAPANDDFANASLISSINSTITGSNVAATAETGEPSHHWSDSESAPIASIWYRWTPRSNGILTLDVSGSQFDYPQVAVYTGEFVSSLTRVGVDMDALTIPVRAGTEYSIAIDTWWPDEVGITRLSGSFRAAPANDDFADAIRISRWSGVIRGTSLGATAEPGERPHAEGDDEGPYHSVWYRWTAPWSGAVEMIDANFDTSNSFIPDLSVYTGRSLSDLKRVASAGYLAEWTVRKGTTYWIASDGHYYEDEEPNFAWRLKRKLSRAKIVSSPRKVTRSRVAKFRFEGDAGAGFQCRLSGQRAWKKCQTQTTFRRLESGSHVLSVRQRYGSTTQPSWMVVRYRWSVR